jgi:NADPH-dependent glutamate synthase beta subunit-like oxidoreductase
MNIRINNKMIGLESGKTILHHARKAGISIPTMCFGSDDYQNHPSCMVCVVMDQQTGRMVPACATRAAEGMKIETSTPEVALARREALELLMSEHVGDCEAPCRNGCPAFMDIPLMNRLIAAGEFKLAHEVVRREIALPLILGFICPAPCEKVCRSAPAGEAIAICQLKKIVASGFYNNNVDFQMPLQKKGQKIAIIGSGPAGLACAFHLAEMGYSPVVFEANEKPGGNLLEISPEKLPPEVLEKEIGVLLKMGVVLHLNQFITLENCYAFMKTGYHAVVLAAGMPSGKKGGDFQLQQNGLKADTKTFALSHPGFFACGSILKEQNMAVKSVAQGKAAAKSVNSFLSDGQPLQEKKRFNSRFGKLKDDEIVEYLKECNPGRGLLPKAGELKGFDVGEAKTEAARCMHCDCRKADGCKLRDYAGLYAIDRRKYAEGNRKSITKHTTHPAIVFEPNKCIRCGLCIEIAKAEKQLAGLTFTGRGFDVKIDIPFDEKIENALSSAALKCAEMCPTAAITKK